MIGKLLGHLARTGWRSGRRRDHTRWARNRDEKLWRRDAEAECTGERGDGCEHPAWLRCGRCARPEPDIDPRYIPERAQMISRAGAAAIPPPAKHIPPPPPPSRGRCGC